MVRGPVFGTKGTRDAVDVAVLGGYLIVWFLGACVVMVAYHNSAFEGLSFRCVGLCFCSTAGKLFFWTEYNLFILIMLYIEILNRIISLLEKMLMEKKLFI